MNIIVDGVAVKTEDEENLKSVLTEMGYAFPCGGKGICGRCRGIATTLEPSALDKKFLKPEEIASGIRLLCDKKVAEGVNVAPLFGKKSADARLTECDAYLILGADSVEVGIVSGDLRLFKVVGCSAAQDRKTLRSIAAHALLDYLEEFSIAKASTVAVFGERAPVEALVSGACDITDGDTFPAADVDLPAADCFVAPCGDGSSIEKLACLKRENESDGEAAARVLRDVRLRYRL